MQFILIILFIGLVLGGIIIYLYKTDSEFKKQFKVKYTSIPENCNMYYNAIKDITDAITDKYVRSRILFLAKEQIIENYNIYKTHKDSEQKEKYIHYIEFIENSNNYNSCKLWANSFFYIEADTYIPRFYGEYERKSFLNLIKETAKFIINAHDNPTEYPKTFLKMTNIDYLKKEYK